MRVAGRAVCVITVAVTGLMPAAMPAVASAPSHRGAAHGAKGCITVTATIPVGFNPRGVAANPKTNTIYVANVFGNTVSVISGETNTVVATIRVGFRPFAIAANPKPSRAYVANGESNTVSVLAPCPK